MAINSKDKNLNDAVKSFVDENGNVVEFGAIKSGKRAKFTISPQNSFENDVTIKDLEDKNDHFFAKKCCTLVWVGIFTILMMVSLLGTYIIWFTDVFNDHLQGMLVIKNNTEIYELWSKPPVEPLLNVHLFNYTNIQRYLNGMDEKLKLEDLGPYVYRQKIEKYDIHFHDNLVTFRDNRTHTFEPILSGNLSENDVIHIPNIPIILVKSHYKDFYKTIVNALNVITLAENFKTQTVKDVLFEYKERILFASGLCSKIQYCADMFGAVANFGLLSMTEQIFKEPVTIYTGQDTIKNLGNVYAYKKHHSYNMWSTDECNKVKGSDGLQFPPKLVSQRKPLELFIPFFCRSLPMDYEKEVKVLDIYPAVRYKIRDNAFSSPEKNPQNSCYYQKTETPPDGIFDTKPCTRNFTVYISFPHFYKGDPVLLEPFEGLNPQKDLHETYVDLNARLGFPMSTNSRFQINFVMKKENFPEIHQDLIVPICWMELTAGSVPKSVKEKFNTATFTLSLIEMSLKLLSITILITSLIMFTFNVRHFIKHFKIKEFKNFYTVNSSN